MIREEQVRKLFLKQRALEAEQLLYQSKRKNGPPNAAVPDENEFEKLRLMLDCIHMLYCLMSADEVMIVRLHFVDGIDWHRIALEYEKRWGKAYAKSERSMIHYQHNALKKAVEFINAHMERYDFSWMERL